MAEKVTLKITSTVAAFVAPGVSVAQKQQGLAAAETMAALDRVTLFFCLMRDQDIEIKQAAQVRFTALSPDVLRDYITDPAAHPAILDYIARFHGRAPGIAEALLALDSLSIQARSFLEKSIASTAGVLAEAISGQEPANLASNPDSDSDSDQQLPNHEAQAVQDSEDELAEEEVGIDEEGDEFLSKYKLAQLMGIGEKIKMALTGDKEWRALLIKDANKLVSGSVIKNPRITEGEVITILKVGVQNDEIIRLICANKEWVKNYAIRKALVDNPKTPLPNALRYLSTLSEKDIAGYAKSKNISSVLSTQAKRILLSKKH